MRAQRARLARLVRALLACFALFLVFAPCSATPGGRAARVCVAEQPTLLLAPRPRASGPAAARGRAARECTLRQALTSAQREVPPRRAACAREQTLAPRSDERYRYLDLLLLLC